MSDIKIEDPIWAAIMADPQLKRARQKLTFHEIRLIVNHALNSGCPFCTGRSKFSGNPEDVFCEKHLRQYRMTGAV